MFLRMDPNTHVSEQATQSLHTELVKRAPVAKPPEWMQKGIEQHKRESRYSDSKEFVLRDNYATYQGMGTVG